MDKAIQQCDKLEKELLKRIKSIYQKAHAEIRRELIQIDKVLEGIYAGTITVPENSTVSAEIWRAGWENQRKTLLKKLEQIAEILNSAGADSAVLIDDTMLDYYAINRQYTMQEIQQAVKNIQFMKYDKETLEVILHDVQPPFSKIAYRNLGNDTKLVSKLQNEFARAILLGEGTKDIAKRLNKIVAYKYAYQAQRLAQTERTRVQSQARYDTAKEAGDMGIVITKKWSATLVNTRDTHRDLNNEEVPFDEPFNLSDGDILEYPGDPKGRAENIINCHCVMITDVVVKGTKQEDIIIANDTAGELLKHYKAVEPKTTDDLQEACDKYGGKLAGLEYKLKSKHSLRRKILSDTEAKKKSIPLVAKEINDVLRYTMVYDEDKLTQAYFDTIDLLKKKQYNVIKVKNTFVKGNSYKGINMILANNKGDNFELQFHTPYSLEVKEKKLHKLYEVQRKLDKVKDIEQIDRLNIQMVQISDTIPHPIDVDKIK